MLGILGDYIKFVRPGDLRAVDVLISRIGRGALAAALRKAWLLFRIRARLLYKLVGWIVDLGEVYGGEVEERRKKNGREGGLKYAK